LTVLTFLSTTRARLGGHPVLCAAGSLLLFLCAFFTRLFLDAVLPPGFPYLTFFPAIVIATFVFGTRAGILCAAMSFLAAWYFFLPPFRTFALSGQTGLALGFFILIVAVDIFIIDRMLAAMTALETSRREALSLASQRDELFKELQHRVGNNLNMISALLNIQARTLSDTAARHALGEAARRIGLVADINRMFHNPSHSDGVLDDAFVRELGTKCLDAAGMTERVRFATDIRALRLEQDEFLHLSLVLTECINNALEHGIGEAGAGDLSVTLHHQDGAGVLRIENDGHPLPPAFDLAKTGSIGLMLVQSFVRQLNGTFSITAGLTTVSEVRFDLSRPPAKA
jgi:two-component sensor histidine kinase